MKWKVASKKVFDMAASVKDKDDQMRAIKKEVEDARAKLALQETENGGAKGAVRGMPRGGEGL